MKVEQLPQGAATLTLAGPESDRDIPLCVDLDGTLVKTDTLHEALLLFLKENPGRLFVLPVWLLKGKARFKQEVCRRVKLDVSTLPYNERLLDVLRKAHGSGRRVVLTTAADQSVAKQVAEHVGLFSEVLASDGVVNLAGELKRAALEKRFGATGFDYAGNGSEDVCVWKGASKALLVNAGPTVLRRARAVCEIKNVLEDRPSAAKVLPKALRMHQWVKNILLFVPLLTSHQFTNLALLASALCGFVAFSLCASSVYVLNDLLDLEADRRHAKKRRRPIAGGDLTPAAGVGLAALCLGGSLLVSLSLPLAFQLVLGLYYVLTLAYTWCFKRKVLLDVHFLGGLYTLRVLAGSAATGVVCSPWLLAFSMFLFLSLALVKRLAELRGLELQRLERAGGRGYATADLHIIASLGTGSGLVSVLVLALYINSPQVEPLYRTPSILWLLCPLMLYWLSRIWLIASRNELDCDPVVFALKDRVSYLVGLGLGIVLLAASFRWSP